MRYPALRHRAVIVAEDITSRFFNVIALLNRAIPVIAVQLSAFQVDDQVVLHFTKVLDLAEPAVDEEADEWVARLAEIAAQMNQHFVSIKVDREERPDIDKIYMQATRLLTGSGGWPNSVFLTPDGKPFYAGGYFPPDDGYGRPGFPRVLDRMHEVWTTERPRVIDVASQVTRGIEQLENITGFMTAVAPPTSEVIRLVKDQLRQEFDSVHGGFGSRTKFPRAPSLDLLLTILEGERDPDLETILIQTLDAMALGGIHDHLAGGFHRYSTEPTWSIPHFEKMLYDNTQLVGLYARAYSLTGRPLYREVVERTIAYLDREMSHPEGGFLSAQDAEVKGEEGASYVWTGLRSQPLRPVT